MMFTADQPLRFGTMVVAGRGARTVSASGTVINDGIFPMGYRGASPAQFTLTYDRGTNDGTAVSLLLQLVLPPVSLLAQRDMSGDLSQFDTDLPGIPVLIPGAPVTYTLNTCATRVCTLTFHVGGRLDVAASNGGAPVSVTLPITAQVISVMQ